MIGIERHESPLTFGHWPRVRWTRRMTWHIGISIFHGWHLRVGNWEVYRRHYDREASLARQNANDARAHYEEVMAR